MGSGFHGLSAHPALDSVLLSCVRGSAHDVQGLPFCRRATRLREEEKFDSAWAGVVQFLGPSGLQGLFNAGAGERYSAASCSCMFTNQQAKVSPRSTTR
jgi:hypothetical protein